MKVLIVHVYEATVGECNGGEPSLDDVCDSMQATFDDLQDSECQTSDDKLFYIPGYNREVTIIKLEE